MPEPQITYTEIPSSINPENSVQITLPSVICRECGRNKIHAKGLCGRCYHHENMRRPESYQRRLCYERQKRKRYFAALDRGNILNIFCELFDVDEMDLARMIMLLQRRHRIGDAIGKKYLDHKAAHSEITPRSAEE